MSRAPQTEDELEVLVKENLRLLVQHPGWETFLDLVQREVRLGRSVLIRGGRGAQTLEQAAMESERARGGLAALEDIMRTVYRHAHMDVDADLALLFD